MVFTVSTLLNKKYPQNILIRKPLLGTLLFLIFTVCFVIIYKPLDVHESRFLNLEMTVIVYFIIAAFPMYGIVRLLNKTKYFANPEEWTILKELLSVAIALSGTGITIYFTGFLLEIPDTRWNLSTFFNSVTIGFLIGLVPFLFFTIVNYRYLFVTDIVKSYHSDTGLVRNEKKDEPVRIISRLKKEELEFYPGQFIYAESDGNYIVFHLDIENQVRKKIIRNSISSAEQQLSEIPFFFRTHRAFIVNLKKVISQKGNTLGYKLRLSGIDAEIPVSRQKAREFDQLMKQYD